MTLARFQEQSLCKGEQFIQCVGYKRLFITAICKMFQLCFSLKKKEGKNKWRNWTICVDCWTLSHSEDAQIEVSLKSDVSLPTCFRIQMMENISLIVFSINQWFGCSSICLATSKPLELACLCFHCGLRLVDVKLWMGRHKVCECACDISSCPCSLGSHFAMIIHLCAENSTGSKRMVTPSLGFHNLEPAFVRSMRCVHR